MGESSNNKLYHFEQDKWMRYVLENGLEPHNGQNSKSIGDEKKVLFYSQGKNGAVAMYMDFLKHYEEFNSKKGDQTIAEYNEKKLNNDINSKEFMRLQKQVKEIETIRKAQSLEEYLGRGPYIEIVDFDMEEIHDKNFNFANSWTTQTIPPSKLKVVCLKEKFGDRVLSEKKDIVNYFLSKMTPEQIVALGVNDDLTNFISQYKQEHKEELDMLGNQFDLSEMPLQQYVNEFLPEPMPIQQMSETIIDELKNPEEIDSVGIGVQRQISVHENEEIKE